jgi:ABC-type uncharacterized transport system YnjBCD substrate-binding protein
MVLGIILFVLLAAGFFVMLMQKRKVTMLLPFFILPIIMIGYPSISSFSGGGFTVEMNATLTSETQALEKNPHDATAKENLQATLTKAVAAGHNLKVSPQVYFYALAQAHFALGNTNAATVSLNKAVQANPKLVIDPKMRFLLKRAPQ